MRIIEETYSITNQDANATVIAACDAHAFDNKGGHKFKFEVRSNAYKFQSFARSFVWSTTSLCWNAVYSIDPGLMVTEEGLYVRDNRGVSYKDFNEDLDHLERITLAIVECRK